MDKSRAQFFALKEYCEKEDYAGWDPFDGLSSKVFKSIGLGRFRLARLAWIQLFKRNPINLRKLFLVPKEHNSKGIALFLTGYVNLYRSSKTPEHLAKIEYLADLLINLQSTGYSGACWGYNFDWQNRVFFQPKNTPTVVASSFASRALFDAYDVTNNRLYLDIGLSTCDFIRNDLRQHEDSGGVLLSYSPLDNSRVYNASLLGAFVLSRAYSYTQDDELKELAKKIVTAVCGKQKKDGSWIYGEAKVQGWIDSFHTGYNLDSIQGYIDHTGDNTFQKNVDLGLKYYVNNFFESDGTPKYYYDSTYPIDIHCPGQVCVTLARLRKTEEYEKLLSNVMSWVHSNMFDEKGYYYYQLKPVMNCKIPYMRWSLAFMFYSLSFQVFDVEEN